MKEKIEKDNLAHIHGYINRVKKAELKDNKVGFYLDVATMAAYQKEGEKEYTRDYTYHSVNITTDDKKVIKALDAIAADLAKNEENKNTKGYKPVSHEGSFDGTFITRKNEAEDGTVYYNNLIVCDAKDIKLDCKLGEKESRNTAMFKGNLVKFEKKNEDFANVTVATHYYTPGAPKDEKDGELYTTKDGVELTRRTSYIDTQISRNFRKELFEALEKNEIAAGDLVAVRGQMHNNNYEDANGVKRYKMVVDINNIEVIYKKGQKAAETEKEAPKAKKTETKAKKAVSKKTRTL